MTEPRKILVNKIMCPDGTILQSFHRHDYKEHVQEDGEEYFIDGGLEYQRYGGTYMDKIINLVVYADSPHEIVRQEVVWGNRFDKNMNPLPEIRWIPIKDLTNEHLVAVYYHTLTGVYNKSMLDEINYRGLNLEDFKND